jgi:pheromone a factor receptor
MLCWVFPFIIMGLRAFLTRQKDYSLIIPLPDYIVQGHRFDIIEDIGCTPAIYISWPSILILDLSAFIPAILSLVFCALALFKLYRRRMAFRHMLGKSESTLTPSRYIRLMIMTFFLGSWNTVLISVSASNEYTTGLQPWTEWASVHADFSFIGQYSDDTDTFSAVTLRCIYILWWAVPISSLSFFAFFGIGEEAMKDYMASIAWVRRVIFRKPLQPVAGGAPMAAVDLEYPVWQPPFKDPRDRPLPPIPMTV